MNIWFYNKCMPKKDQVKEAVSPLFRPITPEQVARRIHSFEGNMAQAISNFSGNMWFVYLHVFWFVAWFFINRGDVSFIQPFDPFPYGLLTMIVSLEAIFLSTFILINQNRQALVDTYRELEEEQEQEEQEEDVEDIQKDIDDIKNAMSFIQTKLSNVEKAQPVSGNGNGKH